MACPVSIATIFCNDIFNDTPPERPDHAPTPFDSPRARHRQRRDPAVAGAGAGPGGSFRHRPSQHANQFQRAAGRAIGRHRQLCHRGEGERGRGCRTAARRAHTRLERQLHGAAGTGPPAGRHRTGGAAQRRAQLRAAQDGHSIARRADRHHPGRSGRQLQRPARRHHGRQARLRRPDQRHAFEPVAARNAAGGQRHHAPADRRPGLAYLAGRAGPGARHHRRPFVEHARIRPGVFTGI